MTMTTHQPADPTTQAPARSIRPGAGAAGGVGGAPAAGDRYGRLTHMIATDQCVILDGANGTELIKITGGSSATSTCGA
jgi:hypothetical protein